MPLIELTTEDIETIGGCLRNERGFIDAALRPQEPELAQRTIDSIDAVLAKLPIEAKTAAASELIPEGDEDGE